MRVLAPLLSAVAAALLILVGGCGRKEGDCYEGLTLRPGENCRHSERSWDQALYVAETIYVFSVAADGKGCLAVGEILTKRTCAESHTDTEATDVWALHGFAATRDGDTWTIDRLP